MFSFEDDSSLIAFEQAEIDSPSSRKETNGRVIYLSRQVQKPKGIGPPVLCDFGAAHFGGKLNSSDVQPNQYRCPEVILDMPWNAQIDVWNAGCMVINDHPTHLMTLVDKSIRSGISLKAEICSVAQIPSMACTVGGLTLPR